MVERREKKVKCKGCGSENVILKNTWMEDQYGTETEGGGTGYIYMGTDVNRHYKCNDCEKTFVIREIKLQGGAKNGND